MILVPWRRRGRDQNGFVTFLRQMTVVGRSLVMLPAPTWVIGTGCLYSVDAFQDGFPVLGAFVWRRKQIVDSSFSFWRSIPEMYRLLFYHSNASVLFHHSYSIVNLSLTSENFTYESLQLCYGAGSSVFSSGKLSLIYSVLSSPAVWLLLVVSRQYSYM